VSPGTNGGAVKKLLAQLWRRSTWTLELIRRGKQEEDEDLGYLSFGLPGTVKSGIRGNRI